ncbi:four helix bundle protein [Verrucomicrobium spinosum]|uniref:four helix bundle protein n=1 Tax=Verrucomicrobium spinosum TaxID=2736 RepID=UPI000ABBA2F3|nr:four helix bundle protein [Verrucomicrobium spinosum]
MDLEATGTSKRAGGFAESFGDLEVYKLAFALQLDIYKASRAWPREETYALTDQIRRSSRSVGACIAELGESAVTKPTSTASCPMLTRS